LFVASVTQGATIVSSDFSLGYGASTNVSPVWTTSETSGANTATTIGDFSFQPAPVTARYSDKGVTFPSRVLTDGTTISMSGWITPEFTVPIVAKYNGAAPADASSTPDYHLVVDITKISMYGGYFTQAGTPTSMAWDEVTPGHSQSSSSVAFAAAATSLQTASQYTQLVWDAGEYSMSLSGLNDTVTRTFDIASPGVDYDNRFCDGLEIEGRVSLVYNSVPEPSAIILAVVGLVGLLAYAWRKRK